MGSHQSHRAGTTTWLTPPHIIEALGPFDLDPCGHPGWATAERLICLPDDGLAVEWSGRVWLNPPYGSEAWTWLDRLHEHGRGTALIFARTETEGFVRCVWGRATAVLFLHGRLHFHYPDGTRAPANSGAPSVLVAYGRADADALRAADLPGTFLDLSAKRTGPECFMCNGTGRDRTAVTEPHGMFAHVVGHVENGRRCRACNGHGRQPWGGLVESASNCAYCAAAPDAGPCALHREVAE